jgi:serpin B
MRRLIGFVAPLSLATALAACGATDPAAAPRPEAPPGLDVVQASVTERTKPTIADGKDITAVGDASSAFALDLYRRVTAGEKGNVVIGPYSAWLALAMTSVAAGGETREELAKVLRLPFPEERLLPALNALDRSIAERSKDSEVVYSVANRIWSQRGLPLKPEFLDEMVEHFGAPVVAADFAGAVEAARQEINGWVGEQTRGRIQQLFPPGVLTAKTVLTLVNAMYLDASWEFPFDPESTSTGAFTRGDGSKVDAEYMHYDQSLPTGFSDGEWQSVELPYAGGGLSMLVIVPQDMAAFSKKFDADLLAMVRKKTKDGGVHLSLPRFAFSTHASLVEPLKKMGLEATFGAADFSRMTDVEGLSVSAVEHEAFVEVDEAGTVAGAASGVAIEGSHGPTLDVDRPFLFVIQDKASHATLFVGRVLDPTAG